MKICRLPLNLFGEENGPLTKPSRSVLLIFSLLSRLSLPAEIKFPQTFLAIEHQSNSECFLSQGEALSQLLPNALVTSPSDQP